MKPAILLTIILLGIVVVGLLVGIIYQSVNKECTTNSGNSGNTKRENLSYKVFELENSIVPDKIKLVLLQHVEDSQIESILKMSGKRDDIEVVSNIPGKNWMESIYPMFSKVTEPYCIVLMSQYTKPKNDWWLDLKQQAEGVHWHGFTWFHYHNVKAYLFRLKNQASTNSVDLWPLSLPEGLHCIQEIHPKITVRKKSQTFSEDTDIPPIIHQTWKSYQQLSEGQEKSMQKIMNLNAEYDHYFWDDKTCQKFIQENFDYRIFQLYNNLVPGAFKADLWRLCVLYVFGGLYLDIDINIQYPCSNWLDRKTACFLVADDKTALPPGRKLCLYNAIIGSVARQKFLKKAVETIFVQVLRVSRTESYATHFGTLDITGPGAFGAAFTDFNSNDNWIQAIVLPGDDKGFDRKVAAKNSGMFICTTKYPGWKEEKLHTGDYNHKFFDGSWITDIQKPFDLLHNFFNNNTKKMRMVFDVFMYNGEIAPLLIRLQSLLNIVDLFVIVESGITYSGNRKTLCFPEDRKKIPEKFLKKISFLTINVDHSHEIDAPLNKGQLGMFRDFHQKHMAMNAAIYHHYISDEDYVIFGDCDEIPDPVNVNYVKTNEINCVVMVPHWFHFSFDNYIGSWDNLQLCMGKLKEYKKQLFNNGNLYGIGMFSKKPQLKGGWHCSYFMEVDAIIQKLKDYGHADENREKILIQHGEEEIKNIIKRGGELFSHNGMKQCIPFKGTFPDIGQTLSNSFLDRNDDEIPRRLVTIWIVSKSVVPGAISKRLSRFTSPKMKLVHYSDENVNSIMESEHISLFNKISAPKYKADLVRFIDLYKYGGFYVDINTEVLRPLVTWLEPEKKISLYTVLGHRAGHICIGTIFTIPKHPVIGSVLRKMISNQGRFEHENKTAPYENHPTWLFYNEICNYLELSDLREGVFGDGEGFIQLDQENLYGKRYGIYNKNRGMMAWTRYKDYKDGEFNVT